MTSTRDGLDLAAIADFRRKLTAGEEEMVPEEIVDRLLSGESRVRVWRQHRGITMAALAAKVGITQPTLSNIEAGHRNPSVDTMRALADALSVTLDDLVS